MSRAVGGDIPEPAKSPGQTSQPLNEGPSTSEPPGAASLRESSARASALEEAAVVSLQPSGISRISLMKPRLIATMM